MMIEIDGRIISSDIFTEHFCCDIGSCKGLCCVHGDSGAPLFADEARIIDEVLPNIEPYMRTEGIEAIREKGTSTVDADGDMVTTLVGKDECVFVIYSEGVAMCAIEKAWLDGAVGFRKPISCHLYPIRVKHYTTFEALNYDVWKVCQPARELGEQKGIPVFRFLKDPLIRAYGQEFYDKMEAAFELLQKEGGE